MHGTHGLQSITVLSVASMLVLACNSTVSSSLENKECTASGQCLPGWMCSEEQVCMKIAPASRDDSQDSNADGGPSGVDAAIAMSPPSIPTSCEGGSLCSGECVDVLGDAANCGACGQRCPGTDHGQAGCNAGQCELVCDQGYSGCGDGCYRLIDDPLHCGDCGFSCPTSANARATCGDSKCGATCNDGFSDCSGMCKRLSNDAQNCGACGRACGANEQCAAGSCVTVCPAGTLDCARSCADPKTDVANCGTCGNVCASLADAAAVCSDGVCASTCNPGLTLCGDRCLDATKDPMNCGTCGKVCSASVARTHAVCAASSCGAECDDGFVACGDQCIGPALAAQSRDPRATCAVLAAAQDRLMCQGMGQNSTFCSNACVNITSDPNNCGTCGRICSGSATCRGGTCLSF